MAAEKEPNGLKPVPDVLVPKPADSGSAPTKRMTVKDWVALVSLVISVLAFAATAITLYLTLLLKADRISVIVDGDPELSFDKDRAQLAFRADNAVITFINSGNRSAAIRRVSLAIKQPLDTEKIKECKLEGQGEPELKDEAKEVERSKEVARTLSRFRYDFEQFVIEPGKILIKQLPLERPADGGAADHRFVPLSKFNESSDRVYALVCLDFDVAVPNGPIQFRQRPIYLFHVLKTKPEEPTHDYEEGYLETNSTDEIVRKFSY